MLKLLNNVNNIILNNTHFSLRYFTKYVDKVDKFIVVYDIGSFKVIYTYMQII